jgi:hypothetical protein
LDVYSSFREHSHTLDTLAGHRNHEEAVQEQGSKLRVVQTTQARLESPVEAATAAGIAGSGSGVEQS